MTSWKNFSQPMITNNHQRISKNGMGYDGMLVPAGAVMSCCGMKFDRNSNLRSGQVQWHILHREDHEAMGAECSSWLNMICLNRDML